jgi:hypothetical protein
MSKLVLPKEISEFYTNTLLMSKECIIQEIQHGLAYGIQIDRLKHLFSALA